MMKGTNIRVSCGEDISKYAYKLPSYANICFDLCCPRKILFATLSRISPEFHKSQERKYEKANKNNSRAGGGKLTKLLLFENSAS